MSTSRLRGGASKAQAWRAAAIALAALNLVTGGLFSHLLTRQSALEARLQDVLEREGGRMATAVERLEALRAIVDRMQLKQDQIEEDLDAMRMPVSPPGAPKRGR